MRDIGLSIVVLIGLVWTIRYPFVGILLWTWITLMDPHKLAFGFSLNFKINLLVAVVTLGSWFLNNKERKMPPVDANLIFTLLFFLWTTLNTSIGSFPWASWHIWDRTWRIMLLGVMIAITATNRTRIHALILIDAMSLLWYGTKGGGFTLMTGGANHVMGPADTTIGDNNQLALAILMVIPLGNYIRLQSKSWWLKLVFLAGMGLSVISVLGSYSRGAFIALAGLSVVAMFRAKHKWLYPLVLTILIVPALQFMPESYFNRINTIQTADSDASFQGRLDAWQVAWMYAAEHFPFGAGFDGPQQEPVFSQYMPGKPARAAHSIYFEVLGDNGFVGLFLYLGIVVTAFRNSMTIRKYAKGNPELSWAFDLASMIQLTLFAFCLGGAALSFAYYDNLFVCAGLLSVMRELVVREATEKGWRRGPAGGKASGPVQAPTLVTE
jgi:probable O-glycosylation ligase (exosortase A-associated)